MNVILTDVLLHVPDGEGRWGQLEAQALHLGDPDGVAEAVSLQVSGGHLLALHLHHDLIAAETTSCVRI